MSKESKTGPAADLPTVSQNTRDMQRTVSNEGGEGGEGNDGGVTPRSHELGLCNIPRHRFLTEAEWLILAHGVGGVKDAENQAPLHPVSCGLPDRYGYDMAEFGQVEDHIREILDTAMVPANHTIDQALAECFDIYQHAKRTVLANKPVTYTTSRGLQAGRRFVPVAAPGPSATAKWPSVKGEAGGGSGAEAGK
ncbi:hypothetical protein G7Z17_g12473 [Cylindrodendrum hubeiense]|uniref:Uncharacterized protein n=1 Tax=Cylindrodendrum hubeiense TaxID=595255 RepID=A0A9P5GYU4_9HYPO|nr:hypothetical protein G7Z17_g12473 [Cylindrodendrum hubeiense]